MTVRRRRRRTTKKKPFHFFNSSWAVTNDNWKWRTDPKNSSWPNSRRSVLYCSLLYCESALSVEQEIYLNVVRFVQMRMRRPNTAIQYWPMQRVPIFENIKQEKTLKQQKQNKTNEQVPYRAGINVAWKWGNWGTGTVRHSFKWAALEKRWRGKRKGSHCSVKAKQCSLPYPTLPFPPRL